MRGKLTMLLLLTIRSRITPADAGKTMFLIFFSAGLQDHPRGCGENRSRGLHGSMLSGSPPRMRGKRTHGGDAVGCIGITPADAGKTLLFEPDSPKGWDHPRGCGENEHIRN